MNAIERKKADKQPATFPIGRHLMVGAGIGLYFGWFFRPVREPSIAVILFLGLLITFALTGWQILRRKQESRTIGQIIKRMPTTFIQYAVVLSILEARHFAFEFGGRFAVIIMTTVMGGIAGIWMAYKQHQTTQ
ncbi:MAG: hypothetical protein AAF490_16360 [Chloroflexota bacterium]